MNYQLILLVSASFLALAVLETAEGHEPVCYWSGTSPACHGSCETGEFVAATNAYGDGKTCVSGWKKLCCKMPPQWIAQIPPHFLLLDKIHQHPHH